MEENNNNEINVKIKFNSNEKVDNASNEIKMFENSKELEKLKNLEIIKNEINIIYFFISEFGLVFIMGLILLIIYLSPQYHPAKTFTSKISNKIFDSNYLPKILIHTTDLHITRNKQNRLDGSTIFVTSLLEYKSDSFLMTGDIVDNWLGKRNSVGGQNEEDWKIYNISIRTPLSKFEVIDVSGNHDLWAVKEATSYNNYFLDHSFKFNRDNIKNEEDFFIKKIIKFDKTFILLNDYRFPVIRPPYGKDNHINKKQLDYLENYLDNLKEDECIILSHYPVDRAILTKSSNGSSFEEIISNKKVSFIFTGHYHPKKVIMIHHGSEGGLEFCTSSAFDKKRAGLITIDNDNLIYHEVYIPYYGSKPLFFLTYPVPEEQISSHHIFNLNNFEIRVISYHSDINIKLKVEGDVNGDLSYYKTLKNGAFLFTLPVYLSDGAYKIHIYDENRNLCDIETKFIIGQKYKGKKEIFLYNINFELSAKFMLIPFWLFLFIIILPLNPNINLNIVKNLNYLIEGKKNNLNNDINKFLLIIYLIIFSPFFIRLRFQVNINILKYAIFIAFIYPLILPIHFAKNFDGIIGYSFLVFYVTKSKVIYEHWALYLTFIYYAGIIFPYVLFLSIKGYYKKSKIIFLISCILSLALFVMAFYFNFKLIRQSISLGFLFLTPAFIIVWLVLLILCIKYYN